MASWSLTCVRCNQRLAQFHIEDILENYFLPTKPDFLKGGKEFKCPFCGHKATYQQADLVYMSR